MEHPHAVVAVLLLLLLPGAPDAPKSSEKSPCTALSEYVVSVASDATSPEIWAATELVAMLQRVACPPPAAASCRGPLLVNASGMLLGQPQIAVGYGAAV